MGEIFNNRLLFNSIMLLFSLLCSGEFCEGQGFYGEGQSRVGRVEGNPDVQHLS